MTVLGADLSNSQQARAFSGAGVAPKLSAPPTGEPARSSASDRWMVQGWECWMALPSGLSSALVTASAGPSG